MEKVGENNNDVKFVIQSHSVKPLLLANDTLHVPSHVLLPSGSLFAFPYPESLHPFETHELLSISELTAVRVLPMETIRDLTQKRFIGQG